MRNYSLRTVYRAPHTAQRCLCEFAGEFLYLSPTASFLSAAKEKRKRNAAKNYVFGFPYAASPDFSLVEISHANVVPWKLHRNIALSLLLGALPLLL